VNRVNRRSSALAVQVVPVNTANIFDFPPAPYSTAVPTNAFSAPLPPGALGAAVPPEAFGTSTIPAATILNAARFPNAAAAAAAGVITPAPVPMTIPGLQQPVLVNPVTGEIVR